MAEQLALDQRLGERAAVDRDERPVSPFAQLVHVASHDLLAGPGLADDQGRRLAGRDLAIRSSSARDAGSSKTSALARIVSDRPSELGSVRTDMETSAF
jgi:hypothetical protein